MSPGFPLKKPLALSLLLTAAEGPPLSRISTLTAWLGDPVHLQPPDRLEALPGTHPVLLLRLQLPHALQQPGLGPVQVCSKACDGDDVGLQLRGWDVDIHLRGDGSPQDGNVSIWPSPRVSLEVISSGLSVPFDQGHPCRFGTRRVGSVHPCRRRAAADKEQEEGASAMGGWEGPRAPRGCIHPLPAAPVTELMPHIRSPGKRPARPRHLKLVHHPADPAPLLPDDVPVKVKGHIHLDGDRDQRLRKMVSQA